MATLERIWLRGTAVFLLIIFGITLLIVITGVFDPKPMGASQASLQPGVVHLGASAETIMWLETPQIKERGSVRGTAVYRSGEQDVVYGLVLGEPGHYVQVVVSPLGWVEVSEIMNGQQSTVNSQQSTVDSQQSTANSQQSTVSSQQSAVSLIPFQPWPHVRGGDDPNEIWVDWDAGEVTVRINREMLWKGEVDINPEMVGIVGRSFGETAVVDFQMIELFVES